MQPVEKDGETITLAAKYLQEKMKRPSLVRERERDSRGIQTPLVVLHSRELARSRREGGAI